MGANIRLVQPNEADKLQRFLEHSYGLGRGFFIRHYPDLQVRTMQCSLILEENGEIMGHVGAYPMLLKMGDCEIPCGGIGGVAAAKHARGQGSMTQLMTETLKRMREQGWLISALWGDEQRYRNFGYQTCGIKYVLRLTRRSLQKGSISPSTTVREVDPTDTTVLRDLEQLAELIDYGVKRDDLALKLQKPGMRVFMGDEGYLFSSREYSGDLEVSEVISPTGHEAELIFGAMRWTNGDGANIELANARTKRAQRLWRVASSWRINPQGMLRIINWPKLLQSLTPILTQQAAGLPAFAISVGCRWQDDVDVATVQWDGAYLKVSEGKTSESYVEVDAPHLTGLLVGGPLTDSSVLGVFGKMLPVPVHVPSLDHV